MIVIAMVKFIVKVLVDLISLVLLRKYLPRFWRPSQSSPYALFLRLWGSISRSFDKYTSLELFGSNQDE